MPKQLRSSAAAASATAAGGGRVSSMHSPPSMPGRSTSRPTHTGAQVIVAPSTVATGGYYHADMTTNGSSHPTDMSSDRTATMTQHSLHETALLVQSPILFSSLYKAAVDADSKSHLTCDTSPTPHPSGSTTMHHHAQQLHHGMYSAQQSPSTSSSVRKRRRSAAADTVDTGDATNAPPVRTRARLSASPLPSSRPATRASQRRQRQATTDAMSPPSNLVQRDNGTDISTTDNSAASSNGGAAAAHAPAAFPFMCCVGGVPLSGGETAQHTHECQLPRLITAQPAMTFSQLLQREGVHTSAHVSYSLPVSDSSNHASDRHGHPSNDTTNADNASHMHLIETAVQQFNEAVARAAAAANDNSAQYPYYHHYATPMFLYPIQVNTDQFVEVATPTMPQTRVSPRVRATQTHAHYNASAPPPQPMHATSTPNVSASNPPSTAQQRARERSHIYREHARILHQQHMALEQQHRLFLQIMQQSMPPMSTAPTTMMYTTSNVPHSSATFYTAPPVSTMNGGGGWHAAQHHTVNSQANALEHHLSHHHHHQAHVSDVALMHAAEHMAAMCHKMPKGMSRAQIDQLPTYRWSSAVEKEAHACVVCMYDVQPRQTVRALPCNHVYHARCIDKWLKTNRTCPVCRQDASKYSETKHELLSSLSGPSTSSLSRL